MVILRSVLEVKFAKYCTCAAKNPGPDVHHLGWWTGFSSIFVLEPYMLKTYQRIFFYKTLDISNSSNISKSYLIKNMFEIYDFLLNNFEFLRVSKSIGFSKVLAPAHPRRTRHIRSTQNPVAFNRPKVVPPQKGISRWWNPDESLKPKTFKKGVASTPQHTDSHPCTRPWASSITKIMEKSHCPTNVV